MKYMSLSIQLINQMNKNDIDYDGLALYNYNRS